jgi:uncharacterized repeat protein (TIGR01451 family)
VGNTYESPEIIELLDENERPTGFRIARSAHTPNPEIERDQFNNSQAQITIQTATGQRETLTLNGPSLVHVVVGSQGQAMDTDGDGLDQVPTELVSMSLTGNSSMGPVTVTVRDSSMHPNMRSTGEIEERRNTRSGRLDLPPFALTGTADSFFDVFFQIRIGPLVLHSHDPKRMRTTITQKPPDEGETYQNPDVIELYDENENRTGVRITGAAHTPRPRGREADVSVLKTDSPDPVGIEQNLMYILTIRNSGPDSATGVVLVDTLPASVQFVSATPTQGSCTRIGQLVTCNLGTIENGGTVRVTIVVITLDNGTIINTAEVNATEPDPNRRNNTETETTTVTEGQACSCDVSSRTINFGQVPAGQGANQTFNIINNGTSPFTVNSINSTNPAFTIVNPPLPFTVPPGGNVPVTVRLTCPPTGQGPQNGTLSFNINCGQVSLNCGTVNVSGFCVPTAK